MMWATVFFSEVHVFLSPLQAKQCSEAAREKHKLSIHLLYAGRLFPQRGVVLSWHGDL